MGRVPLCGIGNTADDCDTGVERNLGDGQVFTSYQLTVTDRLYDDNRGCPLVIAVEQQQAAESTTNNKECGQQGLRHLGPHCP